MNCLPSDSPRSDHRDDQGDFSRGRIASRIALLVFLGIALFFLLTKHRAHLYGALPFLLVLACPVMHLFHHRGPGQHRHLQPTDRGHDRPASEGDWK